MKNRIFLFWGDLQMQKIEINSLYDGGGRLVGYLHDYFPEKMPDHAVRPCVIVCPGGAYEFLSPREADPVAFTFLSHGYNAFVMYYSVAETAPTPLGIRPLAELVTAIRTIRANAEKWHIRPDQIAVCGFSAGGHLCASSGLLWDCSKIEQALGGDLASGRPDAIIPCYPVISAGEFAHRGSFQNLTGGDPQEEEYFSLEKHARKDAPPSFFWHTLEDELVPVENTMMMVSALKKAGAEAECHIFRHGLHGLSLANNEVGTVVKPVQQWVPLCLTWLDEVFGFEE